MTRLKPKECDYFVTIERDTETTSSRHQVITALPSLLSTWTCLHQGSLHTRPILDTVFGDLPSVAQVSDTLKKLSETHKWK